MKNAQGDVTGIVDSNMNVVVEYSYDTWGKLIDTTGSEANFIGKFNPFRYRGYYYDTETGLYYLGGRYYDPVTGRFLNADEQFNDDSSILGANLFVYCYNNPANMVDFDGRFAIAIGVAVFFLAAAVSISTVAFISTPQFQRSWNQMYNSISSGIARGLSSLGGTMRDAISWVSSQAKTIAKSINDSFARTRTIPNYRREREWHHLVAQAAPNASLARNILNSVGIKINDGENLAYIKTGLHRRLHTNVYYGWANRIVISAYGSANTGKVQQRSNVINALRSIRGYVMTLDLYAPY